MKVHASHLAICAVALAIGLAVRILHWRGMLGDPLLDHPRMDPLYHHTWARAIAGGDLAFNYQLGGTRMLLRPSLYAFAGAQRRLLLIGFHKRMASSIPALAASLATPSSSR